MTRTHLLVVAGLTFIAIGVAAAALGPLPGDVPLRTWLVTRVPSWLAAFLGWMTHAGDWRVVFPATSLLLVSPRIRRRWWIWLPAVIGAPWLADNVVKALVARPRPETAGYGFPSGHTTAIAAYMGAVIGATGELRPSARALVVAAAAAIMTLVGLSRIALGVHWPSDVLGGLAFGLAAAFGAATVADWLACRDAADGPEMYATDGGARAESP